MRALLFSAAGTVGTGCCWKAWKMGGTSCPARTSTVSPSSTRLRGAHERRDPAAPDPERVRHHADTAMYLWCEDLDAAHAFLVSRGIDARPPFVTGYGMRQLCFKDPDGYNICLQHRAA